MTLFCAGVFKGNGFVLVSAFYIYSAVGGEWGEGGGEKRNFNFRELLEKFGVKGITCCHGSPVSDAMFSKVLTFYIIFSFNEIFKTSVFSQSRSQSIFCVIIILTLHVICDIMYCTIPFFETQNGSYGLCTVSKFKAFPS